MKKLLAIALLATTIMTTGCLKDDNTPEPTIDPPMTKSAIGTMTITKSGQEPFVQENITYNYVIDKSVMNVTMLKVKFDAAMPTLNATTVSGITLNATGAYVATSLIPVWNNTPMDLFAMSNITVKITPTSGTAQTLNYQCDCYGRHITFVGTIQ